MRTFYFGGGKSYTWCMGKSIEEALRELKSMDSILGWELKAATQFFQKINEAEKREEAEKKQKEAKGERYWD
jgi:ribosomal protein L14E/L6E/L27E